MRPWLDETFTAQGSLDPRLSWLHEPPHWQLGPDGLVLATAGGTDFWQGTQLNIPGISSGDLLRTNPGSPRPKTTAGLDDTSYYWMTNDQVHVKCLGTIKNGTGEGFLAITPDGTTGRRHVGRLVSGRGSDENSMADAHAKSWILGACSKAPIGSRRQKRRSRSRRE